MVTRSLPLLLLTGTLALAVSGCPSDDDDGDGTTDSGVDTGPKDTGADDTGTGDTGTGDTGTGDTGTEDTGTPDTGTGPQVINFFHTNDEHSEHLGIGPNIDDYPTPSNDEAIKGGIYRKARTLERLAGMADTAGEPYVIANAGDISMGSLFHIANLFASPDYAILSQLGYDVGTFGNHEFDFGVGFLAQMIAQGTITSVSPPAFGTLRVPMVVSNIHFSNTSPDDDALAAFWSESGATGQPIQRWHMQDFGGVNVGFVGYMGLEAALVAPLKSPVTFSLATNATACTTDADCAGSICQSPADDPTSANGNCAVDPSGADPANFNALVAEVASAVAAVRAQGADLVVAVSHAGVMEDQGVAIGVDAALDAQGIPGIDLIVGGHSHTPLFVPVEVPNPNSGRTTYIVQAGSRNQWVGRVRLERPDRDSAWTLDAANTELIEINGTVTTQGLAFLTQAVLDGLLTQIIQGLEGQDAATAGDATLFPGEQCDGTFLPNQGMCMGLVPDTTGGMLACEANRQLDLTGCTLACNANNTVDGVEQCDGTDVPMTCADFGYDGGNTTCNANCTYNFANCMPYFPSLLEIALNFAYDGPEIRDNPDPNMIGDLFFYILGQATFDVGETIAYNESNLANLVADSARFAVNNLDDDAVGQPVEIAITANGIIRDGIYTGLTGMLSFADLFRVLPLGVSPQERTPLYTLVDFWLSVPEVKAGLEVGLSRGLESDSFWLGISGARVEYDLSRPELDRVTRIDLIDPNAAIDPWDDSTAAINIYDAGNFDPNRYVHVTTSLYLALFMEGFGLCPRTDIQGTPSAQCGTGTPAAFFLRTIVPPIFQELKELLALTTYIRQFPNNGTIPTEYDAAVPRRMCCVGAACPADNSRTCQ
jgi:2',3'-cyclic-nucleotide 2'-phosphodiesterase (5'-nucleotidase family)